MKVFAQLICFFVLLVVTACNSPFSKNDPVIVSVGNDKLYLSEIYAKAPDWDSWGNQERLAFLEHWIDEDIVYQEAKSRGIMEDSALAQQIEMTVRKMTVDYFLQTFTDSMLVTDAEKLEFYKSHPEMFLRGKTSATVGVLYFNDWKAGDLFYRTHRKVNFDSVPSYHYLVRKIAKYDSVSVSPDTCLIPDLHEAESGFITQMKVCGGALKIGLVVNKLDSADVYPFEEVAEDVSTRAWLAHQHIVLDRLKKEWKSSRPIFMKTNVFSEKEK